MKRQFKKLSLTELEKIQKNLEKEIQERERREKKTAEVRKKIDALLKDHGVTIGDVYGEQTGATPRKTGRKAPVKYRHQKDTSKTWAGRGRKPRWLEDEIKKGKKLSDFAV